KPPPSFRCQRNLKSPLSTITGLWTVPPEQQAEADELAAALSELQATTVHEYQEVNVKNENIAEWKTKIAEKTQKLSQVKVDVSNLKEDITKLKSQIVESPEELKSQKEKMKEAVKKIKNSIAETDEYVVEMQNRVQSVAHAEAELQQMNSLLQDLESSMNNTRLRQEEVRSLSEWGNMQKELKSLCSEEVQLKRALGMKLDKECKQNIRRQKKRETKEHHVQEVLGQCNQIHQKREEMADKIQAIIGETRQLKAKIKSLRDVCSKETEKAQKCSILENINTTLEQENEILEQKNTDLKNMNIDLQLKLEQLNQKPTEQKISENIKSVSDQLQKQPIFRRVITGVSNTFLKMYQTGTLRYWVDTWYC
uniref:UF2 component of NDC80 kinetochore complex n=1 Tax=Xiphophorus maculatus TaxID=8083 RepID=A0A3B5PXW6_XIPMA